MLERAFSFERGVCGIPVEVWTTTTRVLRLSRLNVFDNQVDPIWRADLFELIRGCDQLSLALAHEATSGCSERCYRRIGARVTRMFGWGQLLRMRTPISSVCHICLRCQRQFNSLVTNPRSVRWGQFRSQVGCRIGSSSVAKAALGRNLLRGTHPQWARDAIVECRRENVAPFLKQWGTYTNHPLVVEEGRTVEYAMQKDPPENGKGRK